MQDVQFYRDLYRYDRRVIENFLRKLERMPRQEAERDRGIGHLSHAKTLLHVIRVYDAWFNYVVPGDMAGLRASHARFAKMESLREVRPYLAETWKGVDRMLKGLTPRALKRVVKAPWMPGRYTLADALVQCSFEEAHHIGEMIGAMWQDDLVPPQMMWLPIQTGKKVSVS